MSKKRWMVGLCLLFCITLYGCGKGSVQEQYAALVEEQVNLRAEIETLALEYAYYESQVLSETVKNVTNGKPSLEKALPAMDSTEVVETTSEKVEKENSEKENIASVTPTQVSDAEAKELIPQYEKSNEELREKVEELTNKLEELKVKR